MKSNQQARMCLAAVGWCTGSCQLPSRNGGASVLLTLSSPCLASILGFDSRLGLRQAPKKGGDERRRGGYGNCPIKKKKIQWSIPTPILNSLFREVVFLCHKAATSRTLQKANEAGPETVSCRVFPGHRPSRKLHTSRHTGLRSMDREAARRTMNSQSFDSSS